MRNSLDKMLANAQNELLETEDSLDAITALCDTEGRDITDEEQKQWDELSARAEQLIEMKDRYQKQIDQRAKIQAAKAIPQFDDNPSQGSEKALTVPARALRYKSDTFENNAEAYAMGQWLGAVGGNARCRQWCRDRNLGFRNAMEEGTDNLGGYSVPDPLAATIIRLVEEYGVFRRFARTAVMTSDTLDVPKQDVLDANGQVAVVYPGEGQPITPSDLRFAQVNLIAKKYATLTLMSTELSEDSVINMVDLVARDIANRMAFAEDNNSFNGDGSPGFGGITGLASALQAGSIITAGAGVWGGVTLDNLHEMVGSIPMYPGIMPRWYMSHYAHQVAIAPLLTQLGGTHMRHFEEGVEPSLLGYPVTYTQVLPQKNAAADQVAIYFGDLDKTAYSGQRRMLWIRVLNELYAASDQIGIQSTMRADSVIHDVGTASVAGGIVGLKLAT